MAKTDRQTDTKVRATWWSVTAYNDDITILEDTTTWPAYVKKLYGGREICPDTKKLHFQGAIQCAAQQRLSCLKRWLPTAHLEPARDAGDLVEYAMKPETAVGEKKEVANPQTYYTADKLALLLAETLLPDYDDLYIKYRNPREYKEAVWSIAFNRVLKINDRLFGQMMNPSFKSAWFTSLSYWIDKARVLAQKDAPVVVLEVPGPSEPV